MPREIVMVGGRDLQVREYTLPPLGPGEVRVRTEMAAPKHGTEKTSLGGESALHRQRWDAEMRMFLPLSEEEQQRGAEHRASEARPMGNVATGVVTEAAPDVGQFQPGDRVFGYLPIREVQQVQARQLRPLDGLTAEAAICSDPAHVAFVAVRDGSVRVEDNVAVYGLGAIGLMAVQIARASGARRIFAIDPMPLRRQYAAAHGADEVLDPGACDAGLEIKLGTQRRGADVAIETSGHSAALHDAIRCVAQCGTVVHVPWSQGAATQLFLGAEWHLNRPTLVGSQAVWNNPDRGHPLWTEERCRAAALEMLRSGRITADGMLQPLVDFEDATAALGLIFSAPEKTIKVGIRFSGR